MSDDKETEAIFSPVMTTWIITVVVGILVPLFTQDLVVNSLGALSGMAQSVEPGSVADSGQQFVSSLLLLGIFALFVTAVVFQFFFIAKTLKLSTVFAAIVTLVTPVVLWVGLPYLLIAVN